MKCSKARRLLSRYVDKELFNQELITQIEEHLHTCSGCQRELCALTAVKDLITQKEKISVKEGFLARLQNRLRGEPQIIRIKWLPQAGDLARKLIPVPVITAILMFSLLFGRLNGTLSPVDEYLFADLSTEEIAILSGYVNNSDLLTMEFTD